MSKVISNERLSKIRSLEELQVAQGKMKRAIRGSERRVVNTVRDARDMFSVKDTIYMAIDIIDEVQSLVRYFLRGMLSSRKCRKKGRRF